MITLDELVQKLGYDVSPHYCRVNTPQPPESTHLFRSAENLGLDGIYVFERAPESLKNHYTPAPAVYVGEAEDVKAVRQIHRKLWNLCFAPFAVIVLPNQVRVYTGFNYSEKEENEGLVDEIKTLVELNRLVRELNATAIDTGMVWQSEYAEKLDAGQRVDRRLLENIDTLGEELTRKGGLKDELANRLIGKYVYLKYLRDRGILTDEWMHEKNISPDDVFSLNATVRELKRLVKELEERFNGKIFPINFEEEEALKDKHVQWVAAIFSGAKIVDEDATPGIVLQLALPFRAYDFEYIPVETLSSIYEQFIFERKAKGAVYTPEALAGYVIAEMDSVKRLERGMKILDPACGSGIFLVLIYRLLIEREIRRQGRKLNAGDLLDILEESIYGVEREPDACYIAEFSLILTLLHYLEPRDLQSLDFRFPALHNNRIFECDFFDLKGEGGNAGFWQKEIKFDWIVGNPPWIMINGNKGKNENTPAYNWMKNPENKKNRPVGNNQVAEAFSWLVTDILAQNGITGLILPAPSLFNLKASDYRKHFFSQQEVLKVTNFANLRETIWGKRENNENKNKPTLPPAVLIYRLAEKDREKRNMIHYGPFGINQLIEAKGKPWVITINENEIKTLSPAKEDAHVKRQEEAGKIETEDALFWKLALWGNHIDRRIIERIKHTFPKTLEKICEENKWWFFEGPQLRSGENNSIEELEYHPELKGEKRFNTTAMNKSLTLYTIPGNALETIPDKECYIRKRGGKKGLKLTQAPHIILSSSWRNFITYSDHDFVIPPRQIGISASIKNNENVLYLKALSLYLGSNLVAYILFFHAPEWGIFRQARKITLSDVREIPVPEFTLIQVEKLARLHEEVAALEKEEISQLISALEKNRLSGHSLSSNEGNEDTGLPSLLTPAEKATVEEIKFKIRKELQEKIDNTIYEILKIPRDMRLVIDDFFNYRLPLDTPSQTHLALKKPTAEELENYARELRDKLDDFLSGESFVRVTIIYSNDLIESIIEVTDKGGPFPIDASSVKPGTQTRATLLTELAGNLRKQVSQWVYIQRGLRLFDGPRIHIYKTPRIIDWTRTQARIDAADIIGELIQPNDD